VNLPRVETWDRPGDWQSALAMATDSKAHFNKCVSQSTKEMEMTTYEYQAATVNGVKGWIVTRRDMGIYSGKAFGKTKKAAREALAN